MKDFFFENDKLLNELDNRFKSNQNEKKEEVLDEDFFNDDIDYDNDTNYENLTTNNTNLKIEINTNTKPKEQKDVPGLDLDDLTYEDINKPINISTVKRGRPKGSLKKVSRQKIVNQKLTISLTKEEKELLEKKAAEDDRSISSFIRIKLKETGVFK